MQVSFGGYPESRHSWRQAARLSQFFRAPVIGEPPATTSWVFRIASQSVPKYRRHRASGQALVEINGRRHSLGPYGTNASKPEYERPITEWLSAGRSAAFGAAVTIASAVERIFTCPEHAKA